jgi:hypothetical protein
VSQFHLTIERKPGLLKRIVCFVLGVCPRCEQTMKTRDGLYYFFCQTPGCEPPMTTHEGPERRAPRPLP